MGATDRLDVASQRASRSLMHQMCYWPQLGVALRVSKADDRSIESDASLRQRYDLTTDPDSSLFLQDKFPDVVGPIPLRIILSFSQRYIIENLAPLHSK